MVIKRFKKKTERKPGPKRDRLLSYLREIVSDEGTIKILNSKKRMDRIVILYGLPECVVTECCNEVKRWWKRQERIKELLHVPI